MLAALVATRPRPQEVLIRVAPGVDPHTHRRIRTGQADTKFGLNIASGAALAGVREVLRSFGLLFTGLHFHVGSNLPDASAHLDALDAVLDFAVQVRAETGLAIEELNVGGGLAIRYLPEDRPASIDEFAEAVTAGLHEGLARRHLPLPRLFVEPGRSIVGEAGTTGGPPALVNAVLDALAPLGVRHLDMPLTSQRIWAAIQRARQSTGGSGTRR